MRIIYISRGLKYIKNIPNPTIRENTFDKKRGRNMGIKI